MNRLHKIIVLLAAAGAAAGARAEISGSGHQQLGCNGKILSLVWNDANGNSIQDADEPALADVTVGISLRDDPDRGEDLLRTNADGSVLFFNLCLRSYLLRIDATTLPYGMSPTSVIAGPEQNHIPDDDIDLDRIRIDLHDNHIVEETVEVGFADIGCALGLEARCIVMTTAPRWDHCHEPEELTMIWDGLEPVRVVAHKGDTSKDVMADVDQIMPGEAVSISVDGAPDDVIWEIFRAGTSDKLGESSFDLSCSDESMDGPEDCGMRLGNGQNGNLCDGECINDWLLEGVVDKHGVEVSLSCTLGEAPAAASCSPQAGELVSYRYRVSNSGASDMTGVAVSDGQAGVLSDVSATTLPPGGSRTYVTNAVHTSPLTNLVQASGSDSLGACSVGAAVDVVIAPPPPCSVSGEATLDLSHDKFKWKLTNQGPDPVTVSRITLSWPSENEDLKEIKISGDKIFEDLRSPTQTVLGAVDFLPDESKRIIESTKTEDLEVKFATHHHGDQQEADYTVAVEFAEGCSVAFGAN